LIIINFLKNVIIAIIKKIYQIHQFLFIKTHHNFLQFLNSEQNHCYFIITTLEFISFVFLNFIDFFQNFKLLFIFIDDYDYYLLVISAVLFQFLLNYFNKILLNFLSLNFNRLLITHYCQSQQIILSYQ